MGLAAALRQLPLDENTPFIQFSDENVRILVIHNLHPSKIHHHHMYLQKLSNVFFLVVMTICLLASPPATRAEPSVEEIVKKSFEIYGGDDSISKLTFSFRQPDASERKLIYTMLWKDYKGKDGFTTKMIFFKEFPPDDKGIAYMSWMYRPDLNRDDDEWLYLPQLRTVRKLSKKVDDRHGEHQHDKDDEFSKSVLHRIQLVPRAPDLDNLRLVRTEEMDGKDYYVVERTPKKNSEDFPYIKTIDWISKDNFLLTKIDYLDMDGKKSLHQEIKWQKVGKAWVWEKVEATDPAIGNTTVLTVSDVRINAGLDDNAFTKRVMKLGIDSLRLAD